MDVSSIRTFLRQLSDELYREMPPESLAQIQDQLRLSVQRDLERIAPLDVPRGTSRPMPGLTQQQGGSEHMPPTQNSSQKQSAKSRRQKRRLGRGLDSLISTPVEVDQPSEPSQAGSTTEGEASGVDRVERKTPPRDGEDAGTDAAVPTGDDATVRSGGGGGIASIPLDVIRPNPAQPRQDFDEASLSELAESIRRDGVMQPILVRPDPNARNEQGTYELIAGERRWRAAALVPLQVIPAIVRNIDDRTAAEWALIENLQRKDLNPVERAEALARLAETFGVTHTELADRLGVDRSSITNLIRLAELDEHCKSHVRDGYLSLGHGRCLLGVDRLDARRLLADQAVKGGWSVRKLERAIRAHFQGAQHASRKAVATAGSRRSAHLDDLEQRLGEHLGTRVRITTGRKKGAGKLTIEFFDLDQFDGLLRTLGFDDG